MASPVALIALFSVFLVTVGITEARKDPGLYRQDVSASTTARNDQALLEEIQRLVHVDSSTLSKEKKITGRDCHTSKKEKRFVTDFEPIPNVSAYGDDAELNKGRSFAKDFEPRPSATAYVENSHKSFVKDFEPRPNVSVYDD